jgi:hypothetical protein
VVSRLAQFNKELVDKRKKFFLAQATVEVIKQLLLN